MSSKSFSTRRRCTGAISCFGQKRALRRGGFGLESRAQMQVPHERSGSSHHVLLGLLPRKGGRDDVRGVPSSSIRRCHLGRTGNGYFRRQLAISSQRQRRIWSRRSRCADSLTRLCCFYQFSSPLFDRKSDVCDGGSGSTAAEPPHAASRDETRDKRADGAAPAALHDHFNSVV